MKLWMLGAIVAGVLVVVGLPTLALTLAAHGTGGDRASAATAAPTPSKDAERDDKAGDKAGKKHGGHHGRGHGFGHLRQGLGGPPFGHGLRPGHRGERGLQHLTPSQRGKVADQLERRADSLDKLATCLRSKADISTCRKAARPNR